ncbi:MAG: response regulator transcription factor [Chloroflexota bacterium]|nr:MAG: response regulator transcription factor [Chloroflexota bacterium]
MTTTPARARIRVMVVDDHPLVRSAVRQALEAADLAVVGEVASAEEALELAPMVRPDVLLVDIELPGMDGLALVRELAPRLSGTRILMLTASREDRHLLDAMRFGAAGYLTKDLSVGGLARAVRAAIEGELAMSRRTAARLVQHLVETSRPGFSAASAADPALGTLTPREAEVLQRLAEGLTDHEIAGILTLSPRTVEMHVSSILHKLRARNRAEAARRYRTAGRGPSFDPEP